MALFRYFKRDSAGTFLPGPKGPLSTSLSTGTIKAANKAVLCDGHGQKARVFSKLLISKIYSKANFNFFESLPLYGNGKTKYNVLQVFLAVWDVNTELMTK